MKTIFSFVFTAIFLLIPGLATASAPICGGQVGANDLVFQFNPVSQVSSADDKEERLLVFLDFARTDRVRLVFMETLTEAEWISLKELRERSGDQIAPLLKRLGAAKTFEVWMGWTPDGYLHFESAQGGLKYTFSCRKPEIASPPTQPQEAPKTLRRQLPLPVPNQR